MSTKEFEEQNQQAIDMANRKRTAPKTPIKTAPAQTVEVESEGEAAKVQKFLLLLLKVFGCLLAAALFLAAEFDPNWKTALCFLGFITFVSMAAILIDRYCRGCCNGR